MITAIRPGNLSSLFISDLHLDASRPAATDAFLRFLNDEAARSNALYILGDLFEYWIGDDAYSAHDRSVIEALARLTNSGVRCFIMHGNRDFLLGDKFCRDSGAILIADPTLIYVGGESVLLSHGDFLCTDDVGYQRFRKIVRSTVFRSIYPRLPMSLKQWLAQTARKKSVNSHGFKPPEILDVNQAAVEKTLTEFEVRTILHGHTHRPGIHEFSLNDGTVRRIVLGDWYTQGSVLRWSDAGPELAALPF